MGVHDFLLNDQWDWRCVFKWVTIEAGLRNYYRSSDVSLGLELRVDKDILNYSYFHRTSLTFHLWTLFGWVTISRQRYPNEARTPEQQAEREALAIKALNKLLGNKEAD